MAQKHTPDRNGAGTPPALFDTLHAEYGFTVDVCATKANAKIARYWDKGSNGLLQPWSGERVWCNPPYRDIPPWLDLAFVPDFVAYLLPARTDRVWWMRLKSHAECHYFLGESPERRVQFTRQPGVDPKTWNANNLTNVLFLFGTHATAGHEAYRSGIDGTRIALRR